MPEILSQASTYKIEILEGQAAGQAVELIGRSLPYRGVKYETEQRIKTTWYPGNPVATQQVMGPVEKPTVITGTWKDIFLGQGIARDLVETFEGLVRTGVSVKVSWGAGYDAPDGGPIQLTQAGAIVRTGIIKRISHTYDRPQDIVWEIEFEWRGRADASTVPILRAGDESPAEGFDRLATTLQEAREGIRSFQDVFTSTSKVSIAFQDAADEIQATAAVSIDTLNAATDVLSGAEELPLNVIERVRGVAKESIAAFDRFGLAVATFPKYLGEVRDDALALLELSSALFEMQRQSDLSKIQAAELDAALSARQAPQVIAEVRAPQGSDLRDLARAYYGDPDLWGIIADFNGLDSSKVPDAPTGPTDVPFRAIRIPERGQDAATNLISQC